MPQNNPTIPIWISLLLDEWEANGHRLGIDLQLRLANYIALRGHEALTAEQWRARLAAILCHNKEDQLAFYELFDPFWEEAKRKAEKKAIAQENEKTAEKTKVELQPNVAEPEDEVYTTVKPEQDSYRLQKPQTKRRGPVHIELSFPPNPARYWNTAPLDQAVRPLLEKEWTHVQEWDPLKSIKATIRSGGIPQLVHRRRKLAPRYLFLIDQRSRYDHLAGLYQDLVLELRSRDLDVEWFYYDTQPHRCWYERRDTSTHTFIERIFSAYENYKLIIIGEPTGLLELPNLRPSNLILDMIDHFPSIALLDTRPTVQWNAEENALNQCMPVVPASAEGLASLIKQWQSTELFTPAYWRLEHQESSVPNLQFDDEASLQEVISNLKVYLGRTGFSWLCAALVYPELHYALTALLNDESIAPNPDLAEFDQNAIWLRSLHRMSRLSWFRSGNVPEKIREQLRSWLPDEQATEVRRQLLEVLELEENRPPKDSYAAASHEFALAWLDFEKEYLKQSTDIEKASLLDTFRRKADTVPLSDINDPLGRQYLYDINSSPSDTDPPRILWVDDKPERIESLRADLEGDFGVRFHLATNLEQALVQLDRIPFQMVITDYSRKGNPQGGEHLLEAMQERDLETPLVVFTSKELVQRIGSRMLSNGAAAVVSEIDELYEQIRTHLGLEVETEAVEESPSVDWDGLRKRVESGEFASVFQDLHDLAKQRPQNQGPELTAIQNRILQLDSEYEQTLGELEMNLIERNAYAEMSDRLRKELLVLIDNLEEGDFEHIGAEGGAQSQTQQTTTDTGPITVSGVVKGTNDERLIGASIIEQGTQNDIITGLDGSFQLTLSSRDAVLQFGYPGYKTISKKVGTSTVMDIVLEAEKSSGNEEDAPSSNITKKMFISYAQKDEAYADELKRHLSGLVRSGQIEVWDESQLEVGEEWEAGIGENLKKSDLIVYLVSADFLASDYIYDLERPTAEQVREDRGAVIIPVIVRDCLWEQEDFAKYQVLPLNNAGEVRPISSFEDRDEAYASIAKSIQEILRNGPEQKAEILSTEERIEQIQNWIKKDELKEAIQELRLLAQDEKLEEIRTAVTLLQGRFGRLERDNRNGVLTSESYNIDRAKITKEVLDHLNEIIEAVSGTATSNETEEEPQYYGRIQQTRDWIVQAKLGEAIAEIQRIAVEMEEMELMNTTTHLSAQYTRNERDNEKGLLTSEDYKRSQDRITRSALEILEELEEVADAKGNSNINTSYEDTNVQPDQTTVGILPSMQTEPGRLSSQEEFQAILNNIRKAGLEEKIQIKYHLNFSPDKFLELLSDPNLDILHFAGGTDRRRPPVTKISKQSKRPIKEEPEGGVYLFEGKAGNAERTAPSYLEKIFIQAQEKANNNIKAVILNRCFAEDTAQAIGRAVEYVVGSHPEVKDEAAIAFAQAFYGYIGKRDKTGKAIDIENAYRNGLNAALAYSEPRNRFFLYKNGIQLERSAKK